MWVERGRQAAVSAITAVPVSQVAEIVPFRSESTVAGILSVGAANMDRVAAWSTIDSVQKIELMRWWYEQTARELVNHFAGFGRVATGPVLMPRRFLR